MNKKNKNSSLSHMFEEVKLSALILDDRNPRFGGLVVNQSQSQILEKLANEKNLLELIESFRQNGYYQAEPLLVVSTKEDKSKYVVIEGNRRLAALKILFDKELLKKYGFSNTNLKLKKSIEEELKNRIPVQIYGDRSDLWSYLGFRHIKGPMEWDPYSKALYIVDLYESGLSIDEIVERIGDQNLLVYKMFNGIRILKQAQKERFIEPDSIQKFAFSHLYTLFNYKNAHKFVGLKIKEGTLLKKDPISSKYLSNLEILVNFIYGDIEGNVKSVVKSQNPDIRRLAAILDNPRSVAELKENANQPGALENIFNSTDEAEDPVYKLTLDSLAKLKKALGNLPGCNSYDPEISKALSEIIQVAEYISRNLPKKNAKRGKKKASKNKPANQLLKLPIDEGVGELVDWLEVSAWAQKEEKISRAEVLAIFSFRTSTEESETKISEIWDEIKTRILHLGHKYPFTLSNNEEVFSYVANSTNTSYLLCLLISFFGLPTLTSRDTSRGSYLFEKLCTHVAQRYVSNDAENGKSMQFGSPRKDWPAKIRSFPEAVSELILRTGHGESHVTQVRGTNKRPGDGGDGGLDVVAWRPCKDSKKGKIILFGQCSTAKDHEIYISKLSQTVMFIQQNLSDDFPMIFGLFVPHALTHNDQGHLQNWERINRSKNIPFDRTRIVFYGSDWSDSAANKLVSSWKKKVKKEGAMI